MRRAVLIAASRFEDSAFAPLQFPVRDAERLRDILADPKLGGFHEAILIANEPGNTARIRLERTARACEPGDLLLFYFSGHGKLDRDGSLALAMVDSDCSVLGATSLVSEEIKRIFNLSRASQKIMILDCCYSGAVGAAGFKGALSGSIESLAQQFRGSFLLTASQRFERAWENENKGAGALTEALIEGVKSGAASKAGREDITLSEIASYVKRTVPQDSPQLPEYWDSGGIGDVVFSRKPRAFDAEWAKNARTLVARYVKNDVFDEDFADSIRHSIRMREDARHEDRVTHIDRLMRREIQVSTFVTTWQELTADLTSATHFPSLVSEIQPVLVTEPSSGAAPLQPSLSDSAGSTEPVGNEHDGGATAVTEETGPGANRHPVEIDATKRLGRAFYIIFGALIIGSFTLLFWFLVPRQAEGPASPETADVVARTPDPAVLLAEKRLPVSAKGVSTDAATTASPPAAVQPPAKSVPARQLPLVFHPAGEKIRIFFDEAEAEPPPSAEPLLDAIAAQYRSLARGGATVRLTVTGHSDGRWGELDYTSGKRAEAVRNKLIARGIPARALRTQNLSNRQPLATTEDDPQNRRVEVSFSVARPS